MNIHEKILNLRNMIPENGATEAEAMTAISLANRLMEKHGISEEELRSIKIKKDMEHATFEQNKKNVDPAVKLCSVMICRFCEVVVWMDTHTKDANFFGLIHDVEMSKFLMELVSKSMVRSWTDYLSEGNYDSSISRHKLYWSFRFGFADRINLRLKEMIDDRKPIATSTGTDLIDLKMSIVEDNLREFMPSLKFSKSRKTKADIDLAAYVEGMSAGDKINLRRPVNESGGTLRIQ